MFLPLLLLVERREEVVNLPIGLSLAACSRHDYSIRLSCVGSAAEDSSANQKMTINLITRSRRGDKEGAVGSSGATQSKEDGMKSKSHRDR